MAKFQVDRTQFPIGQGGFHVTALESAFGDELSMVVDCGGAERPHRRLLAMTFAERRRQHDFLVISHLDNDHINGLPELKNEGVTFDNVFLPHVEVSNYLEWMTIKLSFTSGKGSEIAEFIEVSRRLYGGDFGPVVLVAPPRDDGGDIEVDRVVRPDPNDLFTDDAYTAITNAKGASKAVFSCSQSLPLKRLDWLIRFYSREWLYPDEVGQIWGLDIFSDLRTLISTAGIGGAFNWGQFADDLKNLLKVKVNPAHADQILTLIADPTASDPKAKSLNKLKDEIADGSMSCKRVLSELYRLSDSLREYNDASLCVYSGPAERGVGVRRHMFQRWVYQGHTAVRAFELGNAATRDVGWIHTGDADFSSDKHIDQFTEHYLTETKLTSVLVLPHHGSRHSYRSDMKRLRNLASRLSERPLFIAPANPDKGERHPHGEVEATCRALGDFMVVSEDLSTFYTESVASNSYPKVAIIGEW